VYRKFLIGGCEIRMATVARKLLDRGDECWIVAARSRGKQARQVCEMTGLPRRNVVLLGRLRFQERLHRWLREVEPDVVDFQYPSGLEEFPTPKGSRAVVTVHGWQSVPGPGLVSDVLISVSRLPKDSPARAGRRCFEVWNGVDLDRFQFDPGHGEGIAFFGRPDLQKTGPLARVWDRLPRVDVYGPANYRLRKRLGKRGIPPHVHLCGAADTSQRMQGYRVIFCSALTALEALAQGRLIIAGQDALGYPGQAIAPRPETMEELSAMQFGAGTPGRRPTNADEILEEVGWLMSNEHAELRRFYRDYMEKHHDAAKQAARVREVYEEALVWR